MTHQVQLNDQEYQVLLQLLEAERGGLHPEIRRSTMNVQAHEELQQRLKTDLQDAQRGLAVWPAEIGLSLRRISLHVRGLTARGRRGRACAIFQMEQGGSGAIRRCRRGAEQEGRARNRKLWVV